jgi:hypothetical protein
VLDQAGPNATVRVSAPGDPGLIAIIAAVAEPPALAQRPLKSTKPQR